MGTTPTIRSLQAQIDQMKAKDKPKRGPASQSKSRSTTKGKASHKAEDIQLMLDGCDDEDDEDDDTKQTRQAALIPWNKPSHHKYTDIMLTIVEEDDTHRQAFKFVRRDASVSTNKSQGYTVKAQSEKVAADFLKNDVVVAELDLGGIEIEKMGQCVKNRLMTLSNKFKTHRKALGETGHGLVAEDRAGEITAKISVHVANAWEKIETKFPWYKRMLENTVGSPICDRSAVSNSTSDLNLDVLDPSQDDGSNDFTQPAADLDGYASDEEGTPVRNDRRNPDDDEHCNFLDASSDTFEGAPESPTSRTSQLPPSSSLKRKTTVPLDSASSAKRVKTEPRDSVPSTPLPKPPPRRKNIAEQIADTFEVRDRRNGAMEERRSQSKLTVAEMKMDMTREQADLDRKAREEDRRFALEMEERRAAREDKKEEQRAEREGKREDRKHDRDMERLRLEVELAKLRAGQS